MPLRDVVQISQSAYNAPNGVAGYIRRLSESDAEFHSFGYSLSGTFCSSYAPATSYESNNVKKFRLRIKQLAKTVLSRSKLGSLLLINATFRRNADRAVNSYLSSGICADYLIFHDPFSFLSFINKKPKHREKLAIVTHDNGEFGKMLHEQFPKIDLNYLAQLRDSVYTNADAIVLVGNECLKRFQLLYPRWSNKAFHVHTGINGFEARKRNCPERRLLNLVTVGTVNSRKNQISLIRALLDGDNREVFHLTVVGDGDQLIECKQEVARYHLEDAVDFVGSSSDVGRYLHDADVFCMASKDEGLPVAALEAMSVGLPLALTDVGGCSELIDGNGVLIADSSESAICEALHFLNIHRSELQQYGKKSRLLFEQQHSRKRMVMDFCDIFNLI